MSITLSAADPAAVPNLGGRSCYAGTSSAFTYVIGLARPGGTIEDGVDRVAVECLVEADGSFSVYAGGIDSNGKKPMSFSLSGVASPTESTLGSMSFFSPDTDSMTTMESYPPCTIGPATTVKRGALLTDFTCPILLSNVDTTSGCEAAGTIAIEYCKTGEEED